MSDMRKDVESWLADTGLPWALEAGARHLKVKLVGRLVGIIPLNGRNEADRRARLNIRAQIRRAAREYTSA